MKIRTIFSLCSGCLAIIYAAAATGTDYFFPIFLLTTGSLCLVLLWENVRQCRAARSRR